MRHKDMNRPAPSRRGHRGLADARRRRVAATVIGILVVSVLGAADAAAQVIDRYTCVKDSARRTLEIHRGGDGARSCEVWYGADGELRREAAARNTPSVCEAIARKIHTNLVNGGYSCDALDLWEQPAGSVGTRRPPR